MKVSLSELKELMTIPESRSQNSEALANAAVKPATVRERTRDWDSLKYILDVADVRAVKMNDFLGVMELLAEQYSPSRLEKFRAALVHRQILDLPEAERWSRDERFKIQFKGLLANCTRKRKQEAREKYQSSGEDAGTRGAIFGQRLRELLRWCAERQKGFYAASMKMCYEGLLRSSEIRNLRKRDLIKESNGRWYVRIVGGKHRLEDKVEVVHLRNTNEQLEKMWELLHRGDPENHVFPNWSAKEANSLIKEVSTKFCWEEGRLWSMHSLRHGKAAALKLHGVTTEDRLALGRWRSQHIEKHYSRHSK